MEEEKMLVPSGLKTVDGKDIMCYTGAFYLKNEEKIKRIIKKCEEILDAESEDIKEIQRNIKIKEDSEKYNLDIYINKKHDKLFKELLSDKKEAVKFINHYLHLNLLDDGAGTQSRMTPMPAWWSLSTKVMKSFGVP